MKNYVFFDKISNLGKYISMISPDPSETVVLTDSNVRKFWGKYFSEYKTIELEPGEDSKSLDVVKHIYSQLLELGADRHSVLVGIGGGVITDIAGFVASTYMRGIKFGFVPTTLLAQTDAAIGGKNGVNLGDYKNIVGTFNHPGFALVNVNTLRTLPKNELISGLGEVIKHGLIGNPSILTYLYENLDGVLSVDSDVLTPLIRQSISVKWNIVSRDEREKGERKLLNFGHTFGHGIERLFDLSHGEAVSLGMVVALHISLRKGFLSNKDVSFAEDVLNAVGLPTDVCKYIKHARMRSRILSLMLKDKKKNRNVVDFVLLKGLGHAELVSMSQEVLFKELKAVVHDLC